MHSRVYVANDNFSAKFSVLIQRLVWFSYSVLEDKHCIIFFSAVGFN